VERALLLQIIARSPETLADAQPSCVAGAGENAGIIDIVMAGHALSRSSRIIIRHLSSPSRPTTGVGEFCATFSPWEHGQSQ